MKSWIFEHGQRGLMLVLPAAAVTAASLWTLVSVTLEAAAGSAPGDLLYPAREQALHIQLDLTTDPAERAALELARGHLTASDARARGDIASGNTPSQRAAGREGRTGGLTRPSHGEESGVSGHAALQGADLDEASDGADHEAEAIASPVQHSGGDVEDDDSDHNIGVVDDQVAGDPDDDDQDSDGLDDNDQPSASGDLEDDDLGDDDDDDED